MNVAEFDSKESCEHCGFSIPNELLDANYCPNCCALLPNFKKLIKEYLSRTHFNNCFNESIRQFLKSEYVAAARSATIILENEIKQIIGDDSRFGADLMANAFSFEYDETIKTIKKKPRISVNDLSSKTKRNEQEGIKLLSMGFMMGCRNILAHASGHALPMKCLQIISMCDFILSEIKGRSLAEELSKRRTHNKGIETDAE